MDDVHNLASGTDREVAEWRTTLNNHSNMLNGMSEQIDERFTKVDKRFDKVEAEMRDGFAKVDQNFAKVDQNFAKVETKFKLLQQGQDRITKLLTRHLGEPDEETRAGDADE
jgi:esterase/lipase